MDDDQTRKLLAIGHEPRTLELIKEALLDSGLEILTATELQKALRSCSRRGRALSSSI